MKRFPLRLSVSAVILVLGISYGLAQNSPVITTFTNPTPAVNDFFGQNSVAAMGSDRVIIGAINDDAGAQDAGSVYLFSTSGTLLRTFNNPAPQASDHFGWAVAAVGSDKLIVGVPGDNIGAQDSAGSAYLFSTNGVLLNTFTNPTPVSFEGFGFSVAALGNDRVFIGNGSGGGEVNLFSTNGALLFTFAKPSPLDAYFGWSLAAVGSDRVLIGTPESDIGEVNAGVAYLFGTNGVLLTIITNPTPGVSDFFGCAVAALDSDRVLIGAYSDDTGASGAGAAYLFSTSGTLLMTYTNPTPAVNDFFGFSVAAVGNDRVLIGAFSDDTGASGAGAAYVFNTNGTLLHTITNPAPADFDSFGEAVAAVGADRVLIGAYSDDTGASSAGAAYLFSLASVPPPSLAINRTTTNTVAVTWPSPSTGWTLQQNTNSVSSVNWSNVTTGILDNGSTRSLIVNPPTGNRFYRLKQ